MSLRPTDPVTVSSLGAGAAYLQWVSTYGTAVVTTLAILVGVLAVASKVMELRSWWIKRKERPGDGRDECDSE